MKQAISRIQTRLWVCMLAGIMTLPSASAGYARQTGPIFLVNSTADDVDANPGDTVCSTRGGVCTLRAAIMEINALQVPPSTVVLVSGSTYTLTIKGAGEDDSRTGDLDIRRAMTIRKSGTSSAIVQGDNNWNDRIFHLKVAFNDSVYIDGIQIQNGHSDKPGGGIFIECCHVELSVKDSSVIGNSSAAGGGIANTVEGAVRLDSSTVSGNTAEVKSSTTSADGGGIWNAGNVLIRNSTISGNKATGNGGGLTNVGGTEFPSGGAWNATIANNVADSDANGDGDGGGIFNASDESFPLYNTILAANLDQSSATKLPDCAGKLDVGSLLVGSHHDLIQSLSGCTIRAFSGTITGKSPLLGALQNNGGPTFTHAIGSLSPAIDAGSAATTGINACFGVDQRGVTRPADGNADGIARCDIGAYEARLTLLRILGDPSLEPVETSVFADQHVTYDFGWTVPGPGWRVLDNLQLRISDAQGVALWVRFQEITGTPGTFSLINPQTGKSGPAFPPGSPNRLETSAATLHLNGSAVDDSPGSRVGLSLDLTFKPHAAGRTYIVEVLASDDTGEQQGFTVVGVLTVQ